MANRGKRWQCRCDCGAEAVKTSQMLRRAIGGCRRCQVPAEDLRGVWGTWEALERVRTDFSQNACWLCRCVSCGELEVKQSAHIKAKPRCSHCGTKLA